MHLTRVAQPWGLYSGAARVVTTASLTQLRTGFPLRPKGTSQTRARFQPTLSTLTRRALLIQAAFFSQLGNAFAASGTELAPMDPPPGMQLATFAGGCFWGLELAMQRVAGVNKTTVGYTQGSAPNPSYQQVCSGATGHAEAVQVTYDPNVASYESLLDAFFAQTDPTTLNRQGNDAGTMYRSGIYYHTPEQKSIAEKAMVDVQQSIDQGTFRRTAEKKVVVELLPAKDYFIAEDYHQQYLEKGGRFGMRQSAAKGCKDKIRCYG